MTSFTGMTQLLLIALPLLLSGTTDSTTVDTSTEIREDDGSFTNNDLTITWTSPKLNKEACSSLDKTFTINVSTNELMTNAKLHAWATFKNDCGNVPTETDERIVNGRSVESLSGTYNDAIEVDYETIFAEATKGAGEDICSTDTASTEVKVCILFDLQEGNLVDPEDPDEQVDSTEPNGWVMLAVDTLAPPAPNTPTIVPKDKAIEVSAEVTAEGDSEDLAAFVVRFQPIQSEASDTDASSSEESNTDETSSNEGATEENDNETDGESDESNSDDASTDSGCGTWDSNDYKETNGNIVSSEKSGTVQITVENGIEYEMCVFAEDKSGNRGLPSPTINGSGIDECDFMECYPGQLKTGACNATGAQPWALMLLGLVLLISRRRGEQHE